MLVTIGVLAIWPDVTPQMKCTGLDEMSTVYRCLMLHFEAKKFHGFSHQSLHLQNKIFLSEVLLSLRYFSVFHDC